MYVICIRKPNHETEYARDGQIKVLNVAQNSDTFAILSVYCIIYVY